MKIEGHIWSMSTATRCVDLQSCSTCQENPSCGWCDDGSDTGLGSCFDGGRNGLRHLPSVNESGSCSAVRWYFTSCPCKFCQTYSSSSSSRMHVINPNWSATKQRLHLQSVAEISRHSVLSGDRIRQCETSSGSRHKDTDQCL